MIGQRSMSSTSTCADSADFPGTIAHTCRSCTESTPGIFASVSPTRPYSTPSGTLSSSTSVVSRSTPKVDRRIRPPTSIDSSGSTISGPPK